MKTYQEFITEIIDSPLSWRKIDWNLREARVQILVPDPKNNRAAEIDLFLTSFDIRQGGMRSTSEEDVLAELENDPKPVWNLFLAHLREVSFVSQFTYDDLRAFTNSSAANPDLAAEAVTDVTVESATRTFQAILRDYGFSQSFAWDVFCGTDQHTRNYVLAQMDYDDAYTIIRGLIRDNILSRKLPDPELWFGNDPWDAKEIQKDNNLENDPAIKLAMEQIFNPKKHFSKDNYRLTGMKEHFFGIPDVEAELMGMAEEDDEYQMIFDVYLPQALNDYLDEHFRNLSDSKEEGFTEGVSINFAGEAVGKMSIGPARLIATMLEVVGEYYKSFKHPLYIFYGSHYAETQKAMAGRKNAQGQRHRIYGKVLSKPAAKTLLGQYGLSPVPDASKTNHAITVRGREKEAKALLQSWQ